MAPDVYVGQVTFTSLDAGSPAITTTLDTRFDYCRQKTVDATAPQQFSLAPSGGEATHTLTVAPGPGLTIGDVDVVVTATGQLPGPNPSKPPFGFFLRTPGGVEIELNDHNTNLQSSQFLYDDDTNPGFEGLFNLNGQTSAGTWTLSFKNADTAVETVTVKLSRFEIRIHHQGVTTCTQ